MKLGTTGRFATAAFAAAAFTAVGYAQDTTGAAAQRADGDRDRVVTVTGCVMAEKDVPGRDDNLFQRWGLMDRDYVLTNASAQQAGQSSQAGQSGQAGQTATADRADHSQHAAGAAHRLHADHMLKLAGKDADDLRQYANQRVEIRGKLDDHSWFERAGRADRDRTGTTAMGPATTTGTGTAGTGGTATGTTATGTAGTTGTATTGTTTGTAGAGDRLSSIAIESVRALGPCQQQQKQQ